jgi:hypothetical protein
MKTLVFCLEEPSAREMLKGVLSRFLPEDIKVTYLVFEGKQDLQKQLERRLRGWQQPDSHFIVLQDKDSHDCLAVKRKLQDLCDRAGRSEALVRIACHELESFYLGDLRAVEKGLCMKGLAVQQRTRKYADPDALANAAEELKKLTQGRYQKIQGSCLIGRHMDLEGGNSSHSFNVLIKGIRRLVA